MLMRYLYLVTDTRNGRLFAVVAFDKLKALTVVHEKVGDKQWDEDFFEADKVDTDVAEIAVRPLWV